MREPRQRGARMLSPTAVALLAGSIILTACAIPGRLYQVAPAVSGTFARLQLGKSATPVFWLKWERSGGDRGSLAGLDFDSGHLAGIGYFINIAQNGFLPVFPFFNFAVE